MKNWSKSTLSNKSGKLNDKTHMQITTGNDTLVSDEKLVKKYFIKQIWKVLGQRSLIHKRPLQLPSLIHFLFVGLKCIIFFFSLYIVFVCVCSFVNAVLPAPSARPRSLYVCFICLLCLLASFLCVIVCLFVFNPILVSFISLFFGQSSSGASSCPTSLIICLFYLFIVLACFFPLRDCLLVCF